MVLGIYGAGGSGREVLDLARIINKSNELWQDIVFFVDDKYYTPDTIINGAKLLSYDAFLTENNAADTKIVIASGEPKARKLLRKKTQQDGLSLQTLIHPTAQIGINAKIGEGAIIQFGCFVSCNVTIQTNALLQSYAIVSHDSIIGEDSVVSANVAVAGACIIKEQVFIGLNALIRENITIGSNSIIGMGAVVVRDIPEGVVAIGTPARPVKNNEEGRVFKPELRKYL